jgi:hypothetical protein
MEDVSLIVAVPGALSASVNCEMFDTLFTSSADAKVNVAKHPAIIRTARAMLKNLFFMVFNLQK